jgi:hypothetical protein
MTWTLAPLFGIVQPWNWLLLAGVVVVVGLAAMVLTVADRRRPEKPVVRHRRSRA